jgi:AraC family transcriptional regulator of arabinose operon
LILLTGYHSGRHAQHHGPRVLQVLRRLSDEYDRDLAVADLAQAVAMSPSRPAHLFAMQIGMPLMRMRHAARLLDTTTRQISDIAGAAGFKSLFQFSRQFSRWHNVSPSTFRRRLHDH